MAKFFVGQRVRIVRATHAANNGITGVITAIGRWRDGDVLPSGAILAFSEFGYVDCYLSLDRERHDGQKRGFNRFDQLEPILPEGAQPLGYSFEKMMSEFGVTEAVK